MEEVGWTVTGCAAQLGVARRTLSRLLNGHSGISAEMALGLERICWSNEHIKANPLFASPYRLRTLQESRPSVVTEGVGVTNIAHHHVSASVPGDLHDLVQAGVVRRRAGDEACPQRVRGELPRVQPNPRGIPSAIHQPSQHSRWHGD